MIRHETPAEIASALAKHAPRRMSSLLEPAVGTGRLLEPLHIAHHRFLERIVCLDTDPKALREVQRRFAGVEKQLQLICVDFLQWSAAKHRYRPSNLFDCILMNSPFAGRRGHFVDLSIELSSSPFMASDCKVPIEVAFVVRAIKLLQPAGRLLAVIPSNIVSALSAKWVRDYILSSGSVRYVHELPPYTFPSVEARVYLFVFEKTLDRRRSILSNHDLVKPLVLKIPRMELAKISRFDYRFHEALEQYRRVTESSEHLAWRPLSELATIHRGPIPSPKGKLYSLHTSDYHNGFWRAKDKKRMHSNSSERCIKRGDLLVRRVGRGCSSSIGKPVGSVGETCSDCLLIIRPKRTLRATSLLFAIRVIATSDYGPALIESGTGASYITESVLSEILIPTHLKVFFRSYFSRYERAVLRRDFLAMVAIEHQVQKQLALTIQLREGGLGVG